MGEGPYAGLYGPHSALKALFGLDGAQQAVGAEHVSDIGVYYDPYSPPANWLAHASAQNNIDGLTFNQRMEMFYAGGRF